MVRKQFESRKQGQKIEAELLFLLGSLKYPNIVQLLASYTQDRVSNLVHRQTDFDLHEFLLRPEKPKGFENDFAYFHAMNGSSEGLRYLHSFESRPALIAGGSMLVYHYGIKLKKVFVRGTSFILADSGFLSSKTQVRVRHCGKIPVSSMAHQNVGIPIPSLLILLKEL